MKCASCNIDIPEGKVIRKVYCSLRCYQREYQRIHRKRNGVLEKTCVICGKTFHTHIKHAQTCSKECSTALSRKNCRERNRENYIPKTLKYHFNCDFCGKPYETFIEHQNYCSVACRKAAAKVRKHDFFMSRHKIVFCKNCGKKFEVSSCKQKFCSVKCRFTYTYKIHKEKPKIRKCEFCGNDFLPSRASQKFCSSECMRKKSEIVRKERIANGTFNFSGTRKCLRCGKEFKTDRWHNLYCSRECSRTDFIENHMFHNETVEGFVGKFRRLCKHCGREFTTNGNVQVYCSAACIYDARAAKHDANRGRTAKCEICGKEFVPYCKTQTVCSDECRLAQRRIREKDGKSKLSVINLKPTIKNDINDINYVITLPAEERKRIMDSWSAAKRKEALSAYKLTHGISGSIRLGTEVYDIGDYEICKDNKTKIDVERIDEILKKNTGLGKSDLEDIGTEDDRLVMELQMASKSASEQVVFDEENFAGEDFV